MSQSHDTFFQTYIFMGEVDLPNRSAIFSCRDIFYRGGGADRALPPLHFETPQKVQNSVCPARCD